MIYTEAKRLIRRWGRGTFPSRSLNIKYHAAKRGDGDIWRYLRRAYNFNKKGATATVQSGDTVRYERKSGEFLIERDGLIVTYGRNRPKL